MALVDLSVSAIWLVFLVVVLVAAAVLVGFVLKARHVRDDFPYVKRAALFSPAERSFLGVLEQAVSPEHRVFGKVRLADIVEPRPSLGRGGRQAALNRTTGKHFDFVLCRSDDLSVMAAIELNDRTHRAPRRKERDAFVANVCKAVSLPLIQVPARRAYSVQELQADIMSALSGRSALSREAAAEPAVGFRESLARPTVEAPTCPKCSALMVLRQARSGAKAGEEFWGCSRFPSCRGMMAAGSQS